MIFINTLSQGGVDATGLAPCGCGDRWNGTAHGTYPCPRLPENPILLLFPHIPKTGGSSIVNFFKRNTRGSYLMTPKQRLESKKNIYWECAFQFCNGHSNTEFAGPGPGP